LEIVRRDNESIHKDLVGIVVERNIPAKIRDYSDNKSDCTWDVYILP
jgi:hypothetical protein